MLFHFESLLVSVFFNQSGYFGGDKNIYWNSEAGSVDEEISPKSIESLQTLIVYSSID